MNNAHTLLALNISRKKLVRVYNAHGLLKEIVVGNVRIKYQSYISFSPLSMFHMMKYLTLHVDNSKKHGRNVISRSGKEWNTLFLFIMRTPPTKQRIWATSCALYNPKYGILNLIRYFSNLFMKLKLFRERLCSYNLLKYKSGGSHSSKFIAIYM